MYKASIVGIDKSGKTSVVRALDGIEGIETIYPFKYQNDVRGPIGISKKLVSSLAHFGQDHNSKSISGFAYLFHLVPYFLEEKTKKSHSTLVSDRDPLVDTFCYLDFYLSERYSGIAKPPLRFLLEQAFKYPNLLFYLETSPDVSIVRGNEQNQLHNRKDALSKIRDLFDQETFRLEKKGIRVVRIDTDTKSLEEVIDEVKYTLGKISVA
jgi:thymidylate kinase